MSYKLNPMNANGVNEREFQDLYTKNRTAIEAWAKANPHVKDPREAGFQAITGQPWPSGRSVNGSGQMTKDRTVKSVLGKYVAPIAAGVAAPFILPALLGGGAAGGAAAAGGGAGAAGAGAAGAGTLGAVTGGGATGLLASSGIPLAYSAGAAIPSAAALGSSVAGAGGAGLMGTIASQAAKKAAGSAVSRIADAAGTGVNEATATAAHNRGTKLSYEQEQERLRQSASDDFQRQLIAREVENRAGTKDAMDRLQSASYNAQRKPYVPPTITSNVAGVKPQTVTDFGIGRTNGPTADEMAAYQAQINQSRDRLMSGSQLPALEDPTKRPFFTQLNPNLNPGLMERIGQYAGPALGTYGQIAKYL